MTSDPPAPEITPSKVVLRQPGQGERAAPSRTLLPLPPVEVSEAIVCTTLVRSSAVPLLMVTGVVVGAG